MRHAHFVIATLGACLLLQTRAHAQSGDTSQSPVPRGLSSLPRFGVAEMAHTLLRESLSREVALLQSCLDVLESPDLSPAEYVGKLQPHLQQLRELIEARPALMSAAGAAAAPMRRAQLPDKRSYDVQLNIARNRLLATSAGQDSSLRAMLESLPLELIAEVERVTGRDRVASLVRQKYESYEQVQRILAGVEDAARAQQAVLRLRQAQIRRDEVESAFMALDDVYLTREDMKVIQKPFREGWHALRISINQQRERIMQADCYGVKELESVLPR